MTSYIYEIMKHNENLANKPSVLDNIKAFNRELATYEYIVVNVDGSIIENIKENSFDNYRTLTPEKFKKYKGGICWDYVTYEYKYFKSHFPEVKIKSFFFGIVRDKKIKNTHTFILFYLNDKVYWFEDSWKSHICIVEYNSENEALSDVANNLLYNMKYDDWFVCEYNASNNKYIGIKDTEYIKIMTTLPEYNFKYSKKNNRKIIQSIKLDNRGNIINESADKSTIDKNFKKKSGIEFNIIDINDSKVKYFVPDKFYEWICSVKDKKNGLIAVTKNSQTFAGYVFVSKDKPNNRNVLAPFKVYDKFKGYGLGETLLKEAIERFDANELGVYSDNQVAIRLYKKYGFKEVDSKREKSGDKVIIMKRES